MSERIEGRGTFLNGSFQLGSGERWVTHNPAQNFSEVFATTSDPSLTDEVIAGARAAFTSWSAQPMSTRIERLFALRSVFDEMQVEMADAIVRETGKPRREASGEAKALGARVTLMVETGLKRVGTKSTAAGDERFHPQGVLVVLGPYNYPAHLINAHVIPALLTGNTVVIKPSEYCLMTGELYARAAERAGLPPGVLSMMPGGADVGRALVAHDDVDGVLFTGSYATGRAITESVLDQPGKLLALEMGGKNAAVVLDDADLDQAAAGILQGAYLSAGQRCTATSRVLMSSAIAHRLREQIVRGAARLLPGDPEDPRAPFGPLANRPAFERFLSLRKHASDVAQVLVPGEVREGGAFVTPSVHERTEDQPASGYLDEELFGPDLLLEVVDDDDDAIARLQASPYGLSSAVFTADGGRFERFYREVKSGLWNHNRSTNGASGLLPFGGVNKSGNQRPAGIAAVQYTTFPVAVMGAPFGQVSVDPTFAEAVASQNTERELAPSALNARHQVEGLLERHRLWATPRGDALEVDAPQAVVDALGELVEARAGGFRFVVTLDNVEMFAEALDAAAKQDLMRVNARRALDVVAPPSGKMPRSSALMARMTRGDFVPKERKPAVVDHQRSEGPFLCSVDDKPLAILDAASQIASLGLGFSPRELLRLHDEGTLNSALLANVDTSAREDEVVSDYARFLTEQAGFGLEHTTWASGGAEANERAFDLCRMNGPGGHRVIAFEGSFHGRTLASLFATSNPVKRKPFEIEGYEARFVPFPGWADPRHEPSFDQSWVDSCRNGEPKAGDDVLWQSEAASLTALASAIDEGDVCCVIMEPMQGEGGDQFVTSRFVHGLRALTRAKGIPLVFDEVQTGLGLGGELFWFHRFGLEDGPDCVTLAKKAQLGVCLSTWKDPRPAPAHVAQCARGLAHAKAMLTLKDTQGARDLAATVQSQLAALAVRFAGFIDKPRGLALTFGFDLPSKHEANQVIAQRFYRGYMAYIAGERTVRFRLNHSWTSANVKSLFARLSDALLAVQRGGPEWVAPPWIDPAPVAARPPRDALDIDQMRALSPLALERAADRWLLAHGEGGDDPRAVLAMSHGARIVEIDASDWPRVKDGVMAIENATYEDGRRETEAELKAMVDKTGALSLLAVRGEAIVGYAFGYPANQSTADGPREDPLRGETFYSSNITVHPAARGAGIGLRLKRAQAERAASSYRYMSGRNRVGKTTGMGRVNRALGAVGVELYRGNQYGDLSGEALYYRVPLMGSPGPSSKVREESNLIDWASGIQAPLGSAPARVQRALERGAFRGPVGTKLTLSNFISPEVVRYAELLRALGPKGLPHAFFTSGRDELVDKGLRALRVKRPEGRVLIGLEKQFLGTTTAAARSLTDPAGHVAPFGWFDFPRVPHPAEVGTDAFVGSLMAAVQSLSPERVLAFVVEAVGERSGLVLDDDARDALCALRKDTQIPIVLVESASALGRTHDAMWAADLWDDAPDHVWWYAGAQLGHIFTSDAYFVDKPLTLISTWDGDEISILRAREHLAAAHEDQHARDAFAKAVREVFPEARGQGFLQAVPCDDPADLAARALNANVVVHRGYGSVVLSPALTSTSDEWREGLERLLACTQ